MNSPQRFTQIDAFTDRPFAGNPAAVCVLPSSRDAAWMQRVAQEMNLAETAFLVQRPDGFDLRWFTPTTEVDLCGHATLASAHALWEEGHLKPEETAQFHTRSGVLTATHHARASSGSTFRRRRTIRRPHRQSSSAGWARRSDTWAVPLSITWSSSSRRRRCARSLPISPCSPACRFAA